MALSERELRILRDLEDSLQDCDLRELEELLLDCDQECEVIELQPQPQRRRSRGWLILLCLITPIVGFNLILLGAVMAHGGIAMALLGSAVLAVPCACVGRFRNQRLGDSAELHEASPGSGAVLG
jgi:hypothetical protein